MAHIYGIVDKRNNKIIYVGQTIKDFRKRFNSHIRQCNYVTKKKIHCKMLKDGFHNFEPILLEECVVENLNDREKYFIDFYDTFNNGYNLTIGGDSVNGYKHKKDTKDKISKLMTDRWNTDRENIMQSLKKRPPRKQSKEELVERSRTMSENNPMHNQNVRNKLSDTCKNKYLNGYINPNSKKWKITTPKNEVLVLEDMKSFCKKNNLGYSGAYYAYKNGTIYKGYTIQKVEI